MSYDHEPRRPRMFRSLDDMLPEKFRDPIMDPESGKWLLTEQDTPETEENSGPYKKYGRRKNHPDKNTDSANGWLDDFIAHEFPPMGWLIEPMIPAGGVVFMYGPTSAGKSPFTWALAAAVAEGTSFAGMPVRLQGAVLYIELDTPPALIQPRLAKLPSYPPLFWMEVFQKPIDICGMTDDDPTALRLHALQRKVKPVLVVINTLRKAHAEDDKDSAVPMTVYSAWRGYFPDATLFFVHHDKKAPPVKEGAKKEFVNQDQMFSGSQHWQDDAQVAFHLMAGKKSGGDEDEESSNTPIVVKMTKSQVSAHQKFPLLQMQLKGDGTNWIHSGPAMYREFFRKLPLEQRRAQRIAAVMDEFSISKSTAYDSCIGLK